MREVLELDQLLRFRETVRTVAVERRDMAYAVALADATRHPDQHGLADLGSAIEVGASPRGPIGLIQSAQALALLRGRGYVTSRDIRDVAPDVLRHRLVLTYEAIADGITADSILERVLEAVEAPAMRTRGCVNAQARDPAGPPGPGPMPSAAVAALDLALVRRTGGRLPGEYRGIGVGVGTELAQLRPYQVGDDVRQLDPAASARTGVPHVRQHVPERALTTWLVVDLSPSMAFGSEGRLKSDVAEGVAQGRGAHGRTPRRAPRADRVRRRDAADDPAARRPSFAGRGRSAARARRGAGRRRAAPRPRRGAQASARARAPARARRVASDFRDDGPWPRALRNLVAAGQQVIAVEILDPRELELPDAGVLVMVDPETGRHVEADTGSTSLREAFARRERVRRERLAASLRRSGARHAVVRTDRDWLLDLGRAIAMTFTSPAFLAALRADPARLPRRAAARNRRRRYALRFPAVASVAAVLERRSAWRRVLPAALLGLAVAALAFALARPHVTVDVPIEQASVVLVSDASRLDGGDGRRADAARRRAQRGADVPRPRAEAAARRSRRLLGLAAHGAAPDDRPRHARASRSTACRPPAARRRATR